MLYKSKILTLVTMVYSWYFYEYCLWAQMAVFTHVYVLMLIGIG